MGIKYYDAHSKFPSRQEQEHLACKGGSTTALRLLLMGLPARGKNHSSEITHKLLLFMECQKCFDIFHTVHPGSVPRQEQVW